MATTSRKAKEQMVSVRLSCRISSVTKDRAEQAARALGQTVTYFTEEAILKRAEEVLAAQNRLVLSERDFAAFVEAIQGTPKPLTGGLLAAVKEYEHRHQHDSTKAIR